MDMETPQNSFFPTFRRDKSTAMSTKCLPKAPTPACPLDKSRLLAEIACRPAIWDTRVNFCIRRKQMLRDWPAVAKVMNFSVDECKRLWKGLRGNYRFEMRRTNEGYTGCRWRYFEQMEFMRGVFSGPRAKFTPPVKKRRRQQVIYIPPLDEGGLHFEVPETLCHVVDKLEAGLDIDEEITKLLGSENWLWDPNLDLHFVLVEDPIPCQPLDLRKQVESNDPDYTYLMGLVSTVQSLSDRSRQRFRFLAKDLLKRVMAMDQQPHDT
ncbi:uncharacterized protein LOC119555812 [Drosophila subpulchrella]|uniref:uncharacterized protein LOC119555812 n=1 Tax=Drosophila subpulchrella TaxID=1486046 RepID=UPI0018A14F6E|nr:uncharacterized protein LOC119555812 [Drosophila subpulchrella]